MAHGNPRSSEIRTVFCYKLCLRHSELTFAAFVPSVSFGMAYDFIDSVGNDVDVVSDSEVSVLIAECNRGVCPRDFIASFSVVLKNS